MRIFQLKGNALIDLDCIEALDQNTDEGDIRWIAYMRSGERLRLKEENGRRVFEALTANTSLEFGDANESSVSD